MLWRARRKMLLELLPFIKRKRHRKLADEQESRSRCLADVLLSLPAPAPTAKYVAIIAPEIGPVGELCLFVTHADNTQLKQHVIDHINALIDSGIPVVLILNTSLAAPEIRLPEELRTRLSGCLVRENLGYDFAAWAHACSLLNLNNVQQRLYLVNDSIVGPLDITAFGRMLAHIRATSADLIGLTENSKPRRHLQSFFMVVTGRLLHSPCFTTLINSIVNLPSKKAVIEIYEGHLTRFVSDLDFECCSLFKNINPPLACEDETILNWAGLIERGFPYIKASVLAEASDAAELERLVPGKYWRT